MSESQQKIRGLYEELKGISDSLPEHSWFDDEGFSRRANSAIDRVVKIFPDININDYKIQPQHSQQRGPIIDVVHAKTQLKSLLGRIKGEHGLDDLATTPNERLGNNSVTIINHNTLAVSISNTIEQLIEKSSNQEEKENLSKLSAELNKPERDWEKIKNILTWIMNFSKDLFIQILPELLKKLGT